MKRKGIIITMLLVLLLVPVVSAMSSTHYALDWINPLSSGGGGHAVSQEYAVDITIGQSVIGNSSSASHTANLGFWQRLEQLVHLWLPAIQR